MHILRRLPVGRVLAATAGVLTLSAVGCAPSGEPVENEVLMRSIAFDPPEITIRVGETVTWTNRDLVPHTATSGNPGEVGLGSIFRSAFLLQGQRFTHTFNEAGEFVYFCEVHPAMMRDAKVIVQEEGQ
ncbi:MAG: plastocyanin/azurin family copper-binding protein [Phycisphaerae bacterium]